MKVEPTSLRSRRRRITTVFRDDRRHLGKRCFEDRGGGEEEAAIGLKDDDVVGREPGGRIGLDDVAVVR